MGRQGKRRRVKSKVKRGLEGIIFRKAKLGVNLLEDMVLKAEKHIEEEDEGLAGRPSRVTTK